MRVLSRPLAAALLAALCPLAALAQEPDLRTSEPEGYWGGAASGFSTYLGQDFKPRIAPTANGYWISPFDVGDIGWNSTGDSTFQVHLDDIPNGAMLQAVRWWAHDAHASGDLFLSVQQICQPSTSAGPAVVTLLGAHNTSGSSGDQSGEIVLNVPVDTKACTYRVRVQFGLPSTTIALYKVRAQWVRRVSPAPANARFADVPTNHPFFRFVEALAASGITGGCTTTQYCVDAPVTRGEMAVFLATALGLNWGGL